MKHCRVLHQTPPALPAPWRISAHQVWPRGPNSWHTKYLGNTTSSCVSWPCRFMYETIGRVLWYFHSAFASLTPSFSSSLVNTRPLSMTSRSSPRRKSVTLIFTASVDVFMRHPLSLKSAIPTRQSYQISSHILWYHIRKTLSILSRSRLALYSKIRYFEKEKNDAKNSQISKFAKN